jgi:3-hydroxybutyrate dehydrogenase
MVLEAKGYFRKAGLRGTFADHQPPVALSGRVRKMNIQLQSQAARDARMLFGKVALVTGSTSGIGLGIARALAIAGANVVLNGLGPAEEIARRKDAIEVDHGVKAIYSAADMTSPDAIAEMISTTQREFGRLDILVNNAGIQHIAPLDQFPVAKWDQILAINLTSAFHTMRLALQRCVNKNSAVSSTWRLHMGW